MRSFCGDYAYSQYLAPLAERFVNGELQLVVSSVGRATSAVGSAMSVRASALAASSERHAAMFFVYLHMPPCTTRAREAPSKRDLPTSSRMWLTIFAGNRTRRRRGSLSMEAASTMRLLTTAARDERAANKRCITCLKLVKPGGWYTIEDLQQLVVITAAFHTGRRGRAR